MLHDYLRSLTYSIYTKCAPLWRVSILNKYLFQIFIPNPNNIKQYCKVEGKNHLRDMTQKEKR